ncbi:MAG: hypothetical protein LUG51_03865 [Tannerellaceae bacterium]|nr:hypothetical protein [Tannerellaceae bacterium]
MEEMFTEANQSSDIYVCESCGAPLTYKPGTDSLHCSHCGSSTQIEIREVDEVEELDFLTYVGELEELHNREAKVINCRQCGAESTFEENIHTTECPYCNTPLIEADVHAERLIKPSYLLPFHVSHDSIHTHMSAWMKSLWFAPNKLKSRAMHTEELKGVYIPCWTYDAQTETNYMGQRGDTYTTTVGSGKNRRTVTRTRWSFRSGHVSLFFDDVMVPASRLITHPIMDKIQGWDTKNLVETDPKFLSGFTTEKYIVTLKNGFQTAKAIMDTAIRSAVKRQIGGDRQRILSCKTQYNDIKFKLILLPVYMSSYMYGNKLYHFYVNGRTGKIHGDRPYSPVKITLAVIAAILAILGICWWAEVI